MPIIKPIGDLGLENLLVANAWGFPEIGQETNDAAPGIKQLGFERLVVVEDPDGNLVEVQEKGA